MNLTGRLTLSSMLIVNRQFEISPIAQSTLVDNLSLQLEDRDTGAVKSYPGGLFLRLELEVNRGRHCISIAGPTTALGDVLDQIKGYHRHSKEYKRQQKAQRQRNTTRPGKSESGEAMNRRRRPTRRSLGMFLFRRFRDSGLISIDQVARTHELRRLSLMLDGKRAMAEYRE